MSESPQAQGEEFTPSPPDSQLGEEDPAAAGGVEDAPEPFSPGADGDPPLEDGGAEAASDDIELQAQRASAVKIQSTFRGNKGRERASRRSQELDEAVATADLIEGAGQDNAQIMQQLGSTVRQGGGTLASYFEGQKIVKDYREACVVAGLRANRLVERSLIESCERDGDSFFIEACGNNPIVFSSRVSDVEMQVWSQVFAGPITFLSHLDLSYNTLSNVGAETLARALLPEARGLSVLNLRGNSIGASGCVALCAALKRCPYLRHLDLSHNPIEQAGGLAVVEVVRQSESLEELLIADTEIDIDALVALTTVLVSEGVSTLKVCNIENPRINTLQEEHTVHLGRMLRVNHFLSEIYLGKCRMRDDGIRQLVSFLLENKTLRVLDLRCNEIGAEGAKSLGTLLKTDCQLTSLNLSANRIGEKGNAQGAKAIAEALFNNRMLTHLDLNHNELCGEALQLIAANVDQNSTLESLALFHNTWDQPAAYKFHHILNDRARVFKINVDFVTSEVDLRIDICKIHDFRGSG